MKESKLIDEVILERLFEEKINGLKSLIESNDKAYEQQFKSSQESAKLALASAERAIAKAETATEKRLDSVNEFRATLADQQRNLMPRSEAELMMKNLNTRVDKLELMQSKQEGTKTGISQGYGWVAAIVMLAISLVLFLKDIV